MIESLLLDNEIVNGRKYRPPTMAIYIAKTKREDFRVEMDLALNKEKFKEEILGKDFKGNQAQCARALGISPSYLCNVLKKPEKKPGTALFTGIVIYCDKTNRKVSDFMRWPSPHKRTKEKCPSNRIL